jgi:hypothetical protein
MARSKQIKEKGAKAKASPAIIARKTAKGKALNKLIATTRKKAPHKDVALESAPPRHVGGVMKPHRYR